MSTIADPLVRWRLGAVASVFGCVAPLVGSASAERSLTCKGGSAIDVRVAAVDDNLDLRLEDGRLVRLAGFEPAGSPERLARSRAIFEQKLVGQGVAAVLLSTQADRWGRLPALAELNGSGSERTNLAVWAIGEGLGRYAVETLPEDCRALFLQAEVTARQVPRGLWSEGGAVLAPDDTKAFVERSATNIVVEGRLTAVEPGPYRTKLKFAAPSQGHRDLLTITIVPKTLKTFAERGITLPSLVGPQIRVRGLLDIRFGPELLVAGPDAFEVLAPPATDGARP